MYVSILLSPLLCPCCHGLQPCMACALCPDTFGEGGPVGHHGVLTAGWGGMAFLPLFFPPFFVLPRRPSSCWPLEGAHPSQRCPAITPGALWLATHARVYLVVRGHHDIMQHCSRSDDMVGGFSSPSGTLGKPRGGSLLALIGGFLLPLIGGEREELVP